MGHWTGLSITGDVTIDQARISFLERFITEPQLL